MNIWIVCGAGLLIYGTWWLPRFWNNRGFIPRPQDVRLIPPIVSRGLVRQGHLLNWFAGLALLLIGTSPTHGGRRSLFTSVEILTGAVLLIVLVQFLLNRPRFLVPERYRAERGVLGDVSAVLRARVARRLERTRRRA
jgi:hypothetical protein